MTAVVRGQGRGNLPAEVSSFVDRRRELAEAKRLLSTNRLLTLTGVGGVGKTRLALRVAGDLRRALADGVWLVELAELRDARLVVDAVAAALELHDLTRRSPLDALTDYLASRRLLLVLDNCEHVVAASAALVAAQLKTSAGLRVLATSREPLGVRGEAVLVVPSLSVPDPGRSASPHDVSESAAVTLFAERAATTIPGFDLADDNRAAVVRICQRLDGIPLAIELAAARLRALSADEIARRLSDRYRLLSAGPRDAPERHQTLRACIEWSHDLCSPAERLLWARLSVFSGGFELDAAEAVGAGDGLRARDVADVVASLMEKSILLREPHGSRVRYRLLETIGEYGQQRLQQTGQVTAYRRRHRDWCEHLAGQANAEWVSGRQTRWLARLNRDHQNIQAALEFCLTEPGEEEAALRILVAVPPYYWWARGLMGEGHRWFQRALAPPGEPNRLRASALLIHSMIALDCRDYDTALPRLREGTDLARRLADPDALGLAAYVSGLAGVRRGDLAAARESLETALDAFSVETNLGWRLHTLYLLAQVMIDAGDAARSTAYHQQMLALSEPNSDSLHRSHALFGLGLAAFVEHEWSRAEELLRECLGVARRIESRHLTAWCIEVLAWNATPQHRPARAAALLGAASVLWDRLDSSPAGERGDTPIRAACMRQARHDLGNAAFRTAFRHGSRLGTEEAIAYALGETPSGVSSPTTSSPITSDATLTRREFEVAILVAEGLTNKDIADRLVIAQRTAEGHVEHVLAKLGFHSRSQVAAWVSQHRATGIADR